VRYSDEQRTLAATSPAGLAIATSGGRFKLRRHVEFIDRLIVEAVAGRGPSRLIVVVPPRHGKSELISRHTPAWFLGCFPEKRVMLCTYGDDFAASWGRKNRDLLEEHGGGLYGIEVDQASRAANRWDLKDHEGGMQTAGVGGPITGKGADLLIIDDPIKDSEEAGSELIREKQWEWWLSTAGPRLHPGCTVIVLMTRWHEEDLAGRLLAHAEGSEGEEWSEIRLPCVAEADDPLGRELGEVLWPERWTAEWARKKQADTLPRWWNALYQGRPSPAEGGIFKRAWWKYYVEGEAPPAQRIWTSWDTALKDKTSGDYTVGIAWLQDLANMYVLRIVRGHWSLVEALAQMKAMHDWITLEHGRAGGMCAHYVENAAMGPELITAASRSVPGIIPVFGSTDKVSRAEAVTPALEAGNVFLPAHASTMEPVSIAGELIEECAGFPNGAHDDMVDALVYGIDPRRWTRGAAKRRREGRAPVTAGLSARDV
jgi:predicted phage terminase large subunit-like protein